MELQVPFLLSQLMLEKILCKYRFCVILKVVIIHYMKMVAYEEEKTPNLKYSEA